MSLTDWAGFADAVALANPGACYVASVDEALYYQETPPEVPKSDALGPLILSPTKPPYEIDMYLDPNLELSWEKWIGRWHTRVKSRLQVKFHPGGRAIEDPRAPPHIRSGEIIAYCRPGVKEDFAFAQRLFRLLKKFATTANQACYSYPQYEVRWTQEKGDLNWLGHDAIRWAREDKLRMLSYERRGSADDWIGWGLRPNDEGIVKPWQG